MGELISASPNRPGLPDLVTSEQGVEGELVFATGSPSSVPRTARRLPNRIPAVAYTPGSGVGKKSGTEVDYRLTWVTPVARRGDIRHGHPGSAE